MSMQLPKEAERYSWADYLAWPEGERYELIDGVAYAMSPAPRRRHQETSRAIFRQIDGSLVGKPCEAYFAPFDVKLSAEIDDDVPTVVQPDITVTCDRTKLTEQGMAGPPDLVIEVVSPDSGLIDRRRKFDLYERFGVKEYWIVDQDERVVEVYRLGTDGSYRRIGAFGPEDTVAAEAVPDLAISLKEVFPEAT
jgi:Uma2 family endonuclease